jgi:hypothetical protein
MGTGESNGHAKKFVPGTDQGAPFGAGDEGKDFLEAKVAVRRELQSHGSRIQDLALHDFMGLPIGVSFQEFF